MSRPFTAFSGVWILVALAAFFVSQPRQVAADEPKAAHSPSVHSEVNAAAAEEAGHTPNPIEPTPKLAIWTVVVFVGLLLVLGRFAWKPLIAALHQREEHLEHVLHETERVRNESEALLAEHRRRMASTEEEVRALIAQAKADAQAMAAEIARQAAAEAEATKLRATREISSAKDQALAEIWTRTADIAVSVAGKVLAKSVGPDEHKRLVEVAINELPSESSQNGHAAGGRRA